MISQEIKTLVLYMTFSRILSHRVGVRLTHPPAYHANSNHVNIQKKSLTTLFWTLILPLILNVQAEFKRPSCTKTGGLSRLVGYYETWSSYSWQRPCNTVTPDNIPLGVYTHLNIAYATIDPTTFGVSL